MVPQTLRRPKPYLHRHADIACGVHCVVNEWSCDLFHCSRHARIAANGPFFLLPWQRQHGRPQLRHEPETTQAIHLVLLCTAATTVLGDCDLPGWEQHRLRVACTQSTSAINSTNLPDSFFGIEGGHMIRAGNTLYTVITEFKAPPLWVPSRIALWRATMPAADGKAWPGNWTRITTLFTSEGTYNGTDCRSLRASLGSSAALLLNRDTSHWELFYVGFKSCNDTHFVNRDARIFRAVSSTTGSSGVEGPYHDAGVVINATGKQPWEGVAGVNTMQPYWLGEGRGYAAFYGSGGFRPKGPGRPTVNFHSVGLAHASAAAGPWHRLPGDINPVNLSARESQIEQPMVTRLADGSFVAFFDALSHQKGDIGYRWSPDGLRWDPGCSQMLNVLATSAGPSPTWAKDNTTRTPQGAVELPSRGLLLGFSGYDHGLPPHSHLPSVHEPYWADQHHESMGLVKLAWDRT